MRRTFHLGALAWILISGLLLGQSDKSTIRGTVTDQTGSVVPKAVITLTEVGINNVARTVSTDGNGNYELADLKPGVYRLRAEAAGFKTFIADDVRLDTTQIRRVDMTFQVGSTTESVTVSAGAAVVTTDTGAISGNFSSISFNDSPSVNVLPTPFAMLTTIPGIQGAGWGVRVAGQSGGRCRRRLTAWITTATAGPTPASTEEVRIPLVNSSAENSRITSYNMTSKRGANQYHGMVYYKHFNSGLNSRNFFDPVKTPFIQHEWQGGASGPIWKDKTFFYGSWFSQKIPLGFFNNATVASRPMRRGDFSQFSAANQVLQDPLSAANAAGNRTPFPGQIIPASRISALSRTVLDTYLPEPN